MAPWGSAEFSLSSYPLVPQTWNSISISDVRRRSVPLQISFDNSAAVIPEPATALLVGLGIGGLAYLGRRREN